MGRVADTHKNNTAYEARTLAPFVACAPLFSLTPTHMSSSVPYPLPPSHPRVRHILDKRAKLQAVLFQFPGLRAR